MLTELRPDQTGAQHHGASDCKWNFAKYARFNLCRAIRSAKQMHDYLLNRLAKPIPMINCSTARLILQGTTI